MTYDDFGFVNNPTVIPINSAAAPIVINLNYDQEFENKTVYIHAETNCTNPLFRQYEVVKLFFW
jgi:hypothetical protein